MVSDYYNDMDRQLLRWIILYGYEPVTTPLEALGVLQDYDILLKEGFLSQTLHDRHKVTSHVEYKLRKAVAQYRLQRMENNNE